ncbi:hypothetical protein [Aliikangiella coralliicola]|uniref:Uncharacterized protein n=1 Tax=Aliikangiella coralliicola TaxID=2592383 RepID=A0A545UAS0_9GAMM|nr:hypothetical protein [Aliikangiella coralliicola]TQV86560.1 hypothetical protein FLL46_16780 [Aliikangiella coralliicola]
MKKAFIFLALLIISMPSFGEGGVGEVARIYPHNGKVYFRLKNDSCQSQGNSHRYYYFNLGDETSRAWYSMLLAASSTKTKVSVVVSDCTQSSDILISYIYQDY